MGRSHIEILSARPDLGTLKVKKDVFLCCGNMLVLRRPAPLLWPSPLAELHAPELVLFPAPLLCKFTWKFRSSSCFLGCICVFRPRWWCLFEAHEARCGWRQRLSAETRGCLSPRRACALQSPALRLPGLIPSQVPWEPLLWPLHLVSRGRG